MNSSPVGVEPKVMTQNESAVLLRRYLDGDRGAAAEVFDKYWVRLLALAQTRLSPVLQSRVDPEDIVQSAYRSFFRRAEDLDLSLQRSGDLWRVLAAFTIRKAQKCVEREMAQKRDPRRQICASYLEDAIQSDPTPEDAAILIEEVTSLMKGLQLRDRRIVELRLCGKTVDEIAREFADPESDSSGGIGAISTATIRRVLRNTRKSLENALFDSL